MQLTFSSIEEVQEFVKKLKGTRGGKDKDEPAEQQAPAPLQPPAGAGPSQGFPGVGGFVPPGPGAGQAGAGPFAPAAPQVAPEVLALVTRVANKAEEAFKSGQSTDAAMQWFRSQCGPEAANATWEQIKTIFLVKLAQPTLEHMAKLMNA